MLIDLDGLEADIRAKPWLYGPNGSKAPEQLLALIEGVRRAEGALRKIDKLAGQCDEETADKFWEVIYHGLPNGES